MKHIKKFNNGDLLNTYKKSNFITPHLYLNTDIRIIDYMPKYKQLEYISSTSTGGQYINLGCKLLENTDDIQIDIKFNIKNRGKNSSNLQSSLITSQPEVSPYPGFVLRYNNSNDNEKFIQLQTKWNFTESFPIGNNKYVSTKLSYNNIHRNDNQIYEFTEILDNIPASQINNFECYLFCALNSSNVPFRFIEADLYYLKFTKGNKIIRNLIPVKKISTGEIGLYDMENDHLYVSQGDDPFVAGPTI